MNADKAIGKLSEAGSYLHDYEVTGILTELSSERVELHVVSPSKTRSRVIFHGAELFRMTDFRPQNVISRLLIYDLKKNDATFDVESLLMWMTAADDEGPYMDSEAIAKYKTRMKCYGMSIAYLDPSIGMKFVSVFSKVEL